MSGSGRSGAVPSGTAEMPPITEREMEQSPLLPRVPFGGPAMNVGPVPGGPSSYRPAGLGEHATVAPDIHGGPLDAEPLGYLGDAYGVAICHEKSVAKVLTVNQGCSDNQYMTQARIGKCPAGHMAQMITDWTGQYSPCSECSLYYKWSNVKVRITETDCDGACTSARGDKCSCSCGGEKHGSAWSA